MTWGRAWAWRRYVGKSGWSGLHAQAGHADRGQERANAKKARSHQPLTLSVHLCIHYIHATAQLAWAHPDFGPALAVAATDGSLSIWEQAKGDQPWRRAGGPWPVPGGADAARPPPLAWAPPAHGPRLAAGGGDGVTRVYVGDALLGVGRAWELESECGGGEQARAAPVTALAWRPTGEEEEGSSGNPPPPPPPSLPALPALLATGTAGGDAAVWAYRPSLGIWARAAVLQGGGGGAADAAGGGGGISALAWAPRLGRPTELLASARPGAISLHALAGPVDGPTVRPVATLPAPGAASGGPADGVWALEFDAFGTWLAASLAGRVVGEGGGGEGGDAPPLPPPRVCLWRPTLAGRWELQGEVVAGQ